MDPAISRTTDSWYVDAASGTPTQGSSPVLPSDLQFSQPAPNNALGLEVAHNASSSPHPAYSACIMHHVAPSNGSRYIQALSNDMVSAQQADPSFHSTPIASPFLRHSTLPPNFTNFSQLPSPIYPLRTIAGSVASARHLSLAVPVAQGSPMPPASSAPPQLPPQLPHITHLNNTTGPPRSSPQRKRMWRDSPEHWPERPLSLTRPNMLRAPVPTCAVPIAPLPIHVASVNVPSVTQHLADTHPISNNRDSDDDMYENMIPNGGGDDGMDGEDAIPTGDDRVVESLYEETPRGDIVDLQKLCDLVNELLKTQVNLSRSVKQIDARTQRLMATNTTRPPNGGGSYISPPEPPESINWDQAIQYDEPAGRQRRARRRVLLMALIRETIFKLLSRHSVHDPLPPPPPPALRVPTLQDFAIRWQEYFKSLFNQLAANIVVQKISVEQPGMLS